MSFADRASLHDDSPRRLVGVVACSGESGIDDKAVATIWRALPMLPMPAALPDRLPVTLPGAPGARVAN